MPCEGIARAGRSALKDFLRARNKSREAAGKTSGSCIKEIPSSFRIPNCPYIKGISRMHSVRKTLENTKKLALSSISKLFKLQKCGYVC